MPAYIEIMLLALLVLFVVRVRWVCVQRDRLAARWYHRRANQAAAGDDIGPMPVYTACYASFDTMLLRFWVWHLDDFRLCWGPDCEF